MNTRINKKKTEKKGLNKTEKIKEMNRRRRKEKLKKMKERSRKKNEYHDEE